MTTRISLILAVILLALGCYALSATTTRSETRYRQETRTTKPRNAVIGGTVGAAAGGTTAALVGGIGVGLMGTGIGIPGGALLMAVGALLGAGTGATIGAATGETTTLLIPYTVELTEPTYPSVLGLTLIMIGVALVLWRIAAMLIAAYNAPHTVQGVRSA